MRTDNGVPFASAHALYGLSKLAVWWLRLGIQLERIAPGHPEQNGRHERLHLTLKTEATRPAAPTVLQQQARFDTFAHRFNHERPHQALYMQTPPSRYGPSARVYQGLDELEYPFHDWTAVITTCGRICWQRRKINVSQVFAGQRVGVKQVSEHVWLVTFMDYDLGYFDDETCRLEPIDNPFGPKVLPMSPEWTPRRWRRERDSNPRYPSGYSGFQDHRHRPLGHPSASNKIAQNAGTTQLTTKLGSCPALPHFARLSPAVVTVPVTVAATSSLRAASRRSPDDTMLYRSKMLRVLWPSRRIATRSGIPDRTKFRAAERRKS